MNLIVIGALLCGGIPAIGILIVAKPWRSVRFKRLFIPTKWTTVYPAILKEKISSIDEVNSYASRPAAMKSYTIYTNNDDHINNRILVYKTDDGLMGFLVDLKEYNNRKIGEKGNIYIYKNSFIRFISE